MSASRVWGRWNEGAAVPAHPPISSFIISGQAKTRSTSCARSAGLTLPEADYGKLGTNGEKGTWKSKILAPSRAAPDAMVEALQRSRDRLADLALLSRTPGSLKSGEAQSFLVEIASEVDKPHKQAIAKILMNFATFHLGREEVLGPRWEFLRRYIRYGEGEIEARLSERPFWTGQETEELRFRGDSINVQIENLNGHIVGAIQFYNLHTYEMILAENASLGPDQEIGRRFTSGALPVEDEKRLI